MSLNKINAKLYFILSMDSNTTLYFRAIAIEMPAIRSIEVMFYEWPVLMRLNSKTHLLQMTIELQAAAVNGFLGLVQCKSGQKIDIRSRNKIHLHNYMHPNNLGNSLTSDNDRTTGFTQSSQHFDKSVNKTSGGGTPSHFVRSCSWRRFNWQNISVRNAMKAVNRGLEFVLLFCVDPRTLSLSWYHWRQVLSRASKNVSFRSLAMIDMQNRDVGRAKLIEVKLRDANLTKLILSLTVCLLQLSALYGLPIPSMISHLAGSDLVEICL